MLHRITPKSIAIPVYLLIITTYALITINIGLPKPMEGDMLLYQLLTKAIGTSPIITCLLSLTLITAISVATISIFNIFNLTGPRSNLPLFLYFILFTGANLFTQLSPGLLAMVIIFYSFYSVFISYQKETPVFEAYNAAIGTSIAILLYFPFVYLIPIVLVALIIAGKLNLRTFLAFIIGLISLPLIFGSIFYYYDMWPQYSLPFRFTLADNTINSRTGLWIFIAIILVWTSAGFVVLLNNIALKKILPRKIFIIITTLGICSLVMLASQTISIINIAPFIIIPIVFTVTHLFEHLKQKMRIVFAASLTIGYLASLFIS